MEEIRKKERHLSFGKVFLASLLAVVAGSVLSGLFWLGLFSSLSSLMQAIGAVEADVAATLAANMDHMVIPKEYQHAE